MTTAERNTVHTAGTCVLTALPAAAKPLEER